MSDRKPGDVEKNARRKQLSEWFKEQAAERMSEARLGGGITLSINQCLELADLLHFAEEV